MFPRLDFMPLFQSPSVKIFVFLCIFSFYLNENLALIYALHIDAYKIPEN